MRKSAIVLALVLGVSVRMVQAESPVSFADPKLKAAVESRLGKSNPTPSDMLGLTSLAVVSAGITSVTGLEYATNLTYLYLEINEISDIAPLSGLTELTSLHLGHNQIGDISALSGLTNLSRLTLYHNKNISDISPLSGLTNLTTLYISDNQVSDISALSNLTNLTELGIGSNPISDISALSGLANLTDLYISSAQISDLSALSGLTQLRLLSADYNRIGSVSPLAGLSNLSLLYLYGNQISDVSALTSLTGLTILDLENNPLGNDAYCVYLPQIRANNPGADIRYSPNRNPPSGVSASDGAYFDKVSISWDSLCGVTENVAYRVYRSESSGGTKTALTNWQFSTSFDDTTAAPDVTCYYCVMARIGNSFYRYTDYSSDDTGWRGTPAGAYALTTSSTTGGSVTAPGEGVFFYDPGSSVPVAAVAAANYVFTGWTGAAVSAGKVADPGAASTTVTMDAAYTLVAQFEPTGPIVRRRLTVSSGDGGSVSAPGVGTFEYDDGTWVSITAQADGGYRFTCWSGSAADTGKVTNPGAGTTTVLMDADCEVTANFELVPQAAACTLAVSSTAGGSVLAPGVGLFMYSEGATVSISAQADDRCRFQGWTGTAVDAGKVDNPASANTTVTMDGHYSLRANFIVPDCAVRVVTPNGGEVLNGGSVVPIRWQATGPMERVNIELSLDDGSTWTPVAEQDGAAGVCDWLVPAVNANRCLIRVSAAQDADAFDMSNASFCIRGIVWYVDTGATGAGDGTSWENAFILLQDGLARASAGDGIHVAEGSYWPDLGASRTVGDRAATFQLKNRVAVYGGFPRGGGTWRRRNPLTHRTILSGDIGKPGVSSDNSYHVVTGGSAGSETVLDGCVVTGGFANGAAPHNQGAGMYNQGSPIVRNCVFIANAAAGDGGGVCNSQGSPTFVNCVFTGNTADNWGGGMFNTQSTATIINCTFASNRACWRGGGVYSTPDAITVTNSIFWGNSRTGVLSYDEQAQLSCHPAPAVDHCCVQGWTGSVSGEGNRGLDPTFVDADGPDNIAGTLDDDLRLHEDSPCIDAGDNAAVPVGVATDLQGQPRILGDAVDMGAYEFGTDSDE